MTRRRLGSLIATTIGGTLAFDHGVLHSLTDRDGVVVSKIQHEPTPVSPGDEVTATIDVANLSEREFDIQTAYAIEDPDGNRYHNPSTRRVFTLPGRTAGQVTYSWPASDDIVEGEFTHNASLATRVDKDRFQDVTDSHSFTVQRDGDGIIGEIIDAIMWIPSTLEDVFDGFVNYILGLVRHPKALLHGVRDGLVTACNNYKIALTSLYNQPVETLGQIAGGLLAVLSNLDRPLYLYNAAVQSVVDQMQEDMPSYSSDAAHDAYGTGWPIGWGIIQILIGLLGYFASARAAAAIRSYFGISKSLKAAAAMRVIGRAENGIPDVTKILQKYPKSLAGTSLLLRKVDAADLPEARKYISSLDLLTSLRRTATWARRVSKNPDMKFPTEGKTGRLAEWSTLRQYDTDATYMTKQDFNNADFGNLDAPRKIKIINPSSDGKEMDIIKFTVTPRSGGDYSTHADTLREVGNTLDTGYKRGQIKEQLGKAQQFGLDGYDVGPEAFDDNTELFVHVPKDADDVVTDRVTVEPLRWYKQEYGNLIKAHEKWGIFDPEQ